MNNKKRTLTIIIVVAVIISTLGALAITQTKEDHSITNQGEKGKIDKSTNYHFNFSFKLI